MHLIETYALNCGLKIDKPYVYEHYTSVPFEKFISFNKRQYPFFLEVVQLIKPELDKRDIQILQLRANQETAEVKTCIFDHLTFGQWAYILKHSMLHFGEDDFLFDLAAHYDVPRVMMFSNTYPSTFKPYWGSPEKEKILATTGPFGKPTFSSAENNNFVSYIKPETVAQAIMDLLGIEWSPPYETVYAGKQYRPQHDMIEIVPDRTSPVELRGKVSGLSIRLDYNFDEQFLVSVLEKTKASIVTNKPIPLGLIHNFRATIMDVVYLITDESDVQFARDLAKFNLKYELMSFQHTPKLRERFFEIGAVNSVISADIDKIKELKGGLAGLTYKTAKRIVHGKNEYKGQYDWLKKLPSLPDNFMPCPETANDYFLRELEFYFLVRPKTLTGTQK